MDGDKKLCELCFDNEITGACGVCSSAYCGACLESFREEGIYVNGWLTLDSRCKKCQREGCPNCIDGCHSCANDPPDGFDYPSFCSACSELEDADPECPYHTWVICADCMKKGLGCEECSANRNYAARHG